MAQPKTPEKICYVIMPFSKTEKCTEEEWTEIFEAIIKPAVEGAGLGYHCLRSEATTGNVIKKIVNSLYQANVVIADLTDRNPNVFYELGVRHTLKSRTIMIAQRRKDIPSDLDGYASHVYKWKTTPQREELNQKLKNLLEHIETDIDRSDNPVMDFLGERTIALIDFQLTETQRKLGALQAEFHYTCAILKSNPFGGLPYRLRVATPAMDLLLATRYVYNTTFFHQLHRFRAVLLYLEQPGLDQDGLNNIRELCRILQVNLNTIIGDFQSGTDVSKSKLKPFPGD